LRGGQELLLEFFPSVGTSTATYFFTIVFYSSIGVSFGMWHTHSGSGIQPRPVVSVYGCGGFVKKKKAPDDVVQGFFLFRATWGSPVGR
jgi:hypothetical protein